VLGDLPRVALRSHSLRYSSTVILVGTAYVPRLTLVEDPHELALRLTLTAVGPRQLSALSGLGSSPRSTTNLYRVRLPTVTALTFELATVTHLSQVFAGLISARQAVCGHCRERE
jgi:hypothetical protein